MSEPIEANFDPAYQAAVKEYLARAVAVAGEGVLSATLYGSKARGDDTRDSDIDLLLIITGDHPDLHHELVRLAARVSLEYNVLLDPRVIPIERWEYYARVRHPLWESIQRDGIPLNVERELA